MGNLAAFIAMASTVVALSDSTLAVPVRTPAATAMGAAVVPFAPQPDGQIVVPLYVDEAGPWRFLLDTGSSCSAISEALVARAGMPPVAKTQLMTVAGATMRPVVRLRNLRLGRAHVAEVLAPTLSAEAVRQLGAGVVGILGQDFLSQFTYTLDYRNSRIVWHADGEDLTAGAGAGSPKRVRLALRPSDGRFLIDLPQDATDSAAASAASFVPDSGADGLVLFGSDATNRLLADTAAERGRLVSVGGDHTARQVVLKRLRVGTAALWNQPALVMIDVNQRPHATDRDGLLPLSVFGAVTFNSRDGYLLVEPRD